MGNGRGKHMSNELDFKDIRKIVQIHVDTSLNRFEAYNKIYEDIKKLKLPGKQEEEAMYKTCIILKHEMKG